MYVVILNGVSILCAHIKYVILRTVKVRQFCAMSDGEINLGSVKLGDFNKDWLIVASKLSGRSVRANVISIIGFYLQRQQEKYEKHLEYTAKKYGLTRDECFYRLLNDLDLGDPVNPSDPFKPGEGDNAH